MQHPGLDPQGRHGDGYPDGQGGFSWQVQAVCTVWVAMPVQLYVFTPEYIPETHTNQSCQ